MNEIALNTVITGEGPPIVLLHGFPQTHLMWRHVAPKLAEHHTVICPDLRGYGASSKPRHGYDKRTMAQDVIDLADELQLGTFALVGHDRGVHVAFRAALDHPDRISHLGLLDSVPALDTWDVLRGREAAVAFHLYLMAQPEGLPEELISNSADAFFGHFLDVWAKSPFPDDIRAGYLKAAREAVPSIVADFRALATIDVEHDRADLEAGRKLTMPVAVMQQDWGSQLGFDPTELWRKWATDLRYTTTSAGHFMAEEAPDEVVSFIRDLVAPVEGSSSATGPTQATGLAAHGAR
ncbi:pimeloyl-ACP methyl ester carboxylesterase [Lentzea atacamensis]|uniref:Pimeloyl-ACP methyl ester carboxylesterase n=1 Tax=Lentzea atacamensis TaxID=531938 RepID=A0A316I1D7_9PSEU|nr:alpha/beta hydrolase [Lentzea atacamensis]PWK86507.1 pimeloyl-ACP methyl ester carboxylesterase [Lentzea atacamensis]